MKSTEKRINCIRLITDPLTRKKDVPTDQLLLEIPEQILERNNLKTWNEVPYNHCGTILYLVVVNREGRFIRACNPDDLMNLTTRSRSQIPWKLSSPGKTDAYFVVAIDKQGFIVCGVKNGFMSPKFE